MPTAQQNLGLGTDLSCISDLDPMMVETAGRLGLAQALVRRLQTPTGGLIDDSNYGYDLAGELNNDIGPGDVSRAQTRVVSECLKDERVKSAQCNIIVQPAVGATGQSLIVTITITDNAGPFRLTLSVSNVTVALLQVTQ